MKGSIKHSSTTERKITVGATVFCFTGDKEICGYNAEVVWISKPGKLLNVKGRNGGIHEIRTSSVKLA